MVSRMSRSLSGRNWLQCFLFYKTTIKTRLARYAGLIFHSVKLNLFIFSCGLQHMSRLIQSEAETLSIKNIEHWGRGDLRGSLST